MGTERKGNKITGCNSSYWKQQLIIFLCLLSVDYFAVPVAGFSLKSCRITKDSKGSVVAMCSSAGLKAVPQDIPQTVECIDLMKNKISKIQASDFSNLSVLAELYLKLNWISAIEKGAFSQLISLTHLILTSNKLAKLEGGIFDGLSKLTELKLNKNCIKTVNATCFKPLTNLKTLDLSNNYLHHITKVHLILQQIPKLHNLFLQSNSFPTFQSYELTNSSTELQSLDLSRNPLIVFRITADVFPNLTHLILDQLLHTKHPLIWDVRNKTMLGHISTLDISALHLTSIVKTRKLLESFNSSLETLRMNQIKFNPTELIKLACTIPTISALQLQQNKLRNITSDLFKQCINITKIDLNKNDIERIENNSFTYLPHLRILSLSNNSLLFVPFATRNLPRLLNLDLSFNIISTLRCHDFANMTNLTELFLHNNKITTLNACVFKDLGKLEVLKLQSNEIFKFKKAFETYLSNLKQLYLNNNKITSIKYGEFSGLQSLQSLSLHMNKINMLEKGCFIGLKNLKVILLQSNDIKKEALHQNSFDNLTNLRRLDLSDNHIGYKNSSALDRPPFSQLSHLETLDFKAQHRRGKTVVPSNLLQGLTNLQDFDTRNIQVLFFPEDFFTYTPHLQTLRISSNDLTDVSPNLFSPIPNLQRLYISNTRLSSLDFLLDANLTKLEFLQARKNQFSVISKEVIHSIPGLVYLDLEYNSFTCNCDNAWFLQWVKTSNQTQVNGAYKYKCNYPENLKNSNLLHFDVKSCTVDTDFKCFISTTCMILLLMATSFTYHFLRLHLTYAYYIFLAWLFNTKSKNKQSPHLYDAFVSYNTSDEPWVFRELLPQLEGQQGWRLCLHHRDFQPGRPILDNITDAIYGSRKTVCVISRRYLESEWCSREIQVASFRLFDEQKDVLILVFLEEIPTSQLSPYYRMRKLLKRQTYLSWTRAREHPELFWEKLRQALQTGEDPADERLQLTVTD